MRLKEIPHGLTLAAPTEGYVRSPGLHASDLYNDYFKDFDPDRYDKRAADGSAVPFDLAKMELGTSFEEVLEPALRQRLFGDRPGEYMSPEGIAFSPDYLFDCPEGLVLGEFKLTWYSSRGAPTDKKFAKWLAQIALYLHWLELRKCRLYVFFVNGDYKPPTPDLKAWELTFTGQELTDNYNAIIRHARKKGLLKIA